MKTLQHCRSVADAREHVKLNRMFLAKHAPERYTDFLR